MTTEFKQNLNKATGNSFQLIFPVLPTETSVRDTEILTLNIHGTIIPSITIGTTEVNWQGGRHPMAMAPITYEPWYTNFIVDSRFQNWFKLYKWLAYINNNKDRYDREPRQYWVDAVLYLTDNFDKPVLTVNITNIFPTSLGEMVLSYRDGTENLMSSVSFSYTRLEVVEYPPYDTPIDE